MKKLHYSWIICLGCALLLVSTNGLMVNVYSVLHPYVMEQNHLTNTQASLVVSVRSLASVIGLAFTHAFFRRFSYRTGVTIGALLAAAGCFVFAFARSLTLCFLAAAICGISFALGGMVPVSILISRWFHRRQGLALGICAAGTGLGTVVFSPVLASLAESCSLRTAFCAEGGFCALAAGIVFLLLRDTPEERRLQPFGAGAAALSVTEDKSFRADLSPVFLLLLCISCVIIADNSAGYAHLATHFVTQGIDASRAAAAVSISGITMMVGKCIFGSCCDRLGGARSTRLFGSILVIGYICCCFAGANAPYLPYICTALIGLGVPVYTVGLSIWAADLSTAERQPMVLQRLHLCYNIGSLVFSVLPGVVADLIGSYTPYFVFTILSMVLILGVVSAAYAAQKRK